MVPQQKMEYAPQTLKEYNERVNFSFDILTGKEFRKLRRKQQRKN